METLLGRAEAIGALLKARGETIAVAESSAGGLISAALLSVAGASAYFIAGGVIYTPRAQRGMIDIPREALAGVRSASEPYALLLAETARARYGATWGLSETGAAGPTGNPYGDAAGHTCFALAGPINRAYTLETGLSDRVENMGRFAAAALDALHEALEPSRSD